MNALCSSSVLSQNTLSHSSISLQLRTDERQLLSLLNLIYSFKNINFLKQVLVSECKFLTMNFSFQVILSSFKNNSLFKKKWSHFKKTGINS